MSLPPYWIVPQWPAPANVRAVCTTRAGGVSVAPFDSLNLGDHVGDDPAAVATAAASAARSLEDLREAVSAFDLCELKKGARNTVFADGRAGARVLILGEAPGREEDLEGLPFVGREEWELGHRHATFNRLLQSLRAPDYVNVAFWTHDVRRRSAVQNADQFDEAFNQQL